MKQTKISNKKTIHVSLKDNTLEQPQPRKIVRIVRRKKASKVKKKRSRSKRKDQKKQKKPVVESLARRDLQTHKKLQRSISFQYREYFRECTRFFSKFDHDFKTSKIKPKDVRLLKRKFKLYQGFRKEELKIYTDDQVESYF